MSLVNQMLQDLEQRRTAEAGVSPLGGLSATAALSANGRGTNYLLLGTTLAFAFIAALAAAYMFGALESVLGQMTQEKAAPSSSPNHDGLTRNPVQPALALATTIPAAQPENVESKNRVQAAAVEPLVSARSQSVVKNPPPLSKHHDEQAVSQTKVVKTEAITVVAQTTKQEPLQRGEQSSADTTTTEAGNTNAESVAADVVLPANDNTFHIEKQIRPLTKTQQAQQAFQKAVQLLGRGDEQKARAALNEALSLQPAHVPARETLAALLLNTGHLSEAETLLRTGLRITPSAAALAKLYARLLVDRGDTATAVTVLERALPAAVSDPDYFALLAAFYQRLGRHAQAAQIYRQVLAARPGNASWWLGLAVSLESMAEPTQALEAYERAQQAGGLQANVLRYVQARIAVLTPSAAAISPVTQVQDSDSLEDF